METIGKPAARRASPNIEVNNSLLERAQPPKKTPKY
jgi:hypothetical protein